MLLNLLNNAAKYTERGGHIRLTADRDRDHVVICVKDTGIGIPAAMLPQIFEMFTQLDHSLERSQGGLGIGLTLVRRLVEIHGGTIEARSAGLGHGSEFVVRLPIAGDEPKAQERQSSDTGNTVAAPCPYRILVVDDNRDSADSLSMLFRLRGNEVRTAYDGLEAVDAAVAFQPDAILLDIGLPKLNGYDAARAIRAQHWAKRLVLIALTGRGQEDDNALRTRGRFRSSPG